MLVEGLKKHRFANRLNEVISSAQSKADAFLVEDGENNDREIGGPRVLSKRGQDVKTVTVLHQHVQGYGVGPQFFCLCESLGSRLGHGDLILTPQKVRQQFPGRSLIVNNQDQWLTGAHALAGTGARRGWLRRNRA